MARPHPGGRTVVGHGVQTYNTYLPPRRPSDHAPAYTPTASDPNSPAQQIPAARSAYEGESSSTPIFDALYSEFRRRFRALPGDREGEEELRFTGFGYYGSTSGYAPWERPAPVPVPMPVPVPVPNSPATAGTGYGLSGRHRGYLSLPPGRG
jgi:hypothetical protein